MTVSVEGNKVTKEADGIKVAFDFAFKYQNNTDIFVYLPDEGEAATDADLQTEGVDYVLTPSVTGPNNGGTVTFGIAPADTKEVFIIRELPLNQENQFKPNTNFPERVIESAYDKLTMIDQQLQERIDRSLLLPLNTGLSNIGVPQPQAGRLLGWNDAEDGLENFANIADVPLNTTGLLDGDFLKWNDAGYLEKASDNSITGSAGYFIKVNDAEDGYEYEEIVIDYPLPSQSIENLLLQNDADTEHDINFYNPNSNKPTRVIVRNASYDRRVIEIGTDIDITKQIDATWASGDDAGGLDDNDSLAADTFYYCFMLVKSSDNTYDFGFTTDSTGSSLLTDAAVSAAGFDEISEINRGVLLTDASGNIRTGKYNECLGGGLDFDLDTYIRDYNSAAVSSSFTSSAPVGTYGKYSIFGRNNDATFYTKISNRPIGSAPTASTFGVMGEGASTDDAQYSCYLNVLVDTSTLYIRHSVALDYNCFLICRGYTDSVN